MQKAEPSLKKESPNLEICLLFITLISKNLAGLSVQTVMNRKINCHRSFNGAGLLKYRVPGGCIVPPRMQPRLSIRPSASGH